ncbi:MAG TPA: NfeD family protein [Planctomycetota bacterium]|nr:NfeD family protein [Planctomycetota bacterium]
MSLALAIGLLGLGLAMIVAEVLFPSLGLLSLLATAAIVAALLVAFGESSATGFKFLIAVALLVPAAILVGFKVFPRSPMGRHMVAPGLSFAGEAATDARDRAAIGREGTVESALRPTGIARIDGRRVDVVTRGEQLEPGTRVRVVEVSGNRLVVAAVEAPVDPPQPMENA